MTSSVDNLKAYETALAALKAEPGNPDHKHAAVLALARAGSLDFALSEYMRLGLNELRHHEDIMALGGRLYKDLYLSHHDIEAQEFARLSAEKYEQAYQDTSGYYSGINAATMSLLGRVSLEIIQTRAQRILRELPTHDPANDRVEADVYFTEATRAEAHFLLDQKDQAWASLRRAIDFDPLNFTAHASTLKQFGMIARARDEDLSWLSEFTPPRAVQFAGHIFGLDGEAIDVPILSQSAIDELTGQISDIIQSCDIGFGYGALAAGADIMIAEALLEEGGELHVILPVDRESFIAASVAPFGASWLARFDACMAKASTVTIFDDHEAWPDHMLQHRASLAAMGGAIRRSNALAVEAGQLLIWDGQEGAQGTAYDARLWRDSQRPQFILPYAWPRNAKPHGKGKSDYRYQTILECSSIKSPLVFDDFIDGVKAAIKARMKAPDVMQGLLLNLISAEDPVSSDQLKSPSNFKAAVPGAIHLSELAANYIAVHHDQDFAVDFTGLNDQGLRVFALKERG